VLGSLFGGGFISGLAACAAYFVYQDPNYIVPLIVSPCLLLPASLWFLWILSTKETWRIDTNSVRRENTFWGTTYTEELTDAMICFRHREVRQKYGHYNVYWVTIETATTHLILAEHRNANIQSMGKLIAHIAGWEFIER